MQLQCPLRLPCREMVPCPASAERRRRTLAVSGQSNYLLKQRLTAPARTANRWAFRSLGIRRHERPEGRVRSKGRLKNRGLWHKCTNGCEQVAKHLGKKALAVETRPAELRRLVVDKSTLCGQFCGFRVRSRTLLNQSAAHAVIRNDSPFDEKVAA